MRKNEWNSRKYIVIQKVREAVVVNKKTVSEALVIAGISKNDWDRYVPKVTRDEIVGLTTRRLTKVNNIMPVEEVVERANGSKLITVNLGKTEPKKYLANDTLAPIRATLGIRTVLDKFHPHELKGIFANPMDDPNHSRRQKIRLALYQVLQHIGDIKFNDILQSELNRLVETGHITKEQKGKLEFCFKGIEMTITELPFN